MVLEYGLVNESYKYEWGVVGVHSFSIIPDCRAISLVSARRDWAAFQVLLKSSEDFYVSIGNRTIYSPYGIDIKSVRLQAEIDGLPGAAVEMYPVGLIEDDDRILKSDLLLHDEVVFTLKGRVQPVWVEIKVPVDAKPGIYKGQVQLCLMDSWLSDEEIIGKLSFEIDVKDFLMSEPKDYHMYHDRFQHLSVIAREHEVILWSDEHFRILEGYVKALAELGNKVITIYVSEEPWTGQCCFHTGSYPSDFFEYNMVRTEKDEDGRFIYDFSIVKRYIELCFRYGINEKIEVMGLLRVYAIGSAAQPEPIVDNYPETIRVRYYDKKDKCYRYIRSGMEMREYVRALERFFIEENLADRVIVDADEPEAQGSFKEQLGTLNELAPSFKISMPFYDAGFIGHINEYIGKVDLIVPALVIIHKFWETIDEFKSRYTGKLVWYTATELCESLCDHLLQNRFVGILTAYMGFDGFLRWDFTEWPANPRERISYNYPGMLAGNCYLVYPAKDGRPILSLRYKNFKRGVEDFELIYLLRKLHTNPDAILEKVFEKIVKVRDIKEYGKYLAYPPTLHGGDLYSHDFEDYQSSKALLLDEIIKSIQA